MTSQAGALELQPFLASAVGERLDATVVKVAAPVEDDGLDPGALGCAGEAPADLAGLRLLVALERLRQVRPVRAGERAAGAVVDDLREDAAVRAEHDQARALGRAADL